MLKKEPKRIAFAFLNNGLPASNPDNLRKIVTKDFRNKFGDIDFRIVITRIKDNGVRLYQGYAQEIK
jgi:hypothetical protein